MVSDSDAVEYLHTKHRVSPDMKESVYQSVMAGLNVRCTFRSPDSYVLPLRELVREGRIPMRVIDERVRDILRVKFLVGLFDNPYQTDYEAADREVDGPENNAVALRASRESLVLLKNAGNTLPLDASRLKQLAVIGPNADETAFVHTHYGPLATEAVSVYEGLSKALGNKARVVYEKGCELVDADWPLSEILPTEPTEEELAMIRRAVEAVRTSDAAVVVVGGGPRTCGENKSRTSLDLPGRQQQLLEALHATGKPVILVLINGQPLTVNWANAYIPAILESWFPGCQGGTVIAETLFGEHNPGGKLTVTFPKSVGQIELNFPFKPGSHGAQPHSGPNGSGATRVIGELYPFGFGLSYTTFAYSDLEVSPLQQHTQGEYTIKVNVTNTGKRAGDEVVQLYVRDKVSSVITYDSQLRGFERVSLQPGETRQVTFSLKPEDLQILDRNMNWTVEPGEFRSEERRVGKECRSRWSPYH